MRLTAYLLARAKQYIIFLHHVDFLIIAAVRNNPLVIIVLRANLKQLSSEHLVFLRVKFCRSSKLLRPILLAPKSLIGDP